jgi:hypothetical protein
MLPFKSTNYPMSQQNPLPHSVDSQSDSEASKSQTYQPPTPLRCFSGVLISAPLTVVFYLLTTSIAETFASKPLASNNALANNISVLVRTLVIGVSAMGMGILAITTLGLIALGIQLLIKGDSNTSSSSKAS